MASQKKNSNGGQQSKTALVGILNLQVILAQEGQMWIAQALEFDYAAGGESMDDVKKRFEDGLCATIQDHFSLYGNLDKLLSTKPDPEYTLDLVKDPTLVHQFSQVSVHSFADKALAECAPGYFPYGTIQYVSTKPTPALAHA